jgi:hypothetical protein
LGVGDRPGSNLHWGGVGLVLIFLFLFGKSIRRGAVAFLKSFTDSFFYWDGSTRARAQADFFVCISTRRFTEEMGQEDPTELSWSTAQARQQDQKQKLPLHSYYSLIYRSRTSFTSARLSVHVCRYALLERSSVSCCATCLLIGTR